MDVNSLGDHKNHLECKIIKFQMINCIIEIDWKKTLNNILYIMYETPARTSQRTQFMPLLRPVAK